MADVVERLMNMARAHPDAPAIVEPDRTIGYAAFVEMARAVAAALAEWEAPRVLIALPQGAEAYAAMFGALMAGGIYSPVNVSSPVARLRHIAMMFEPHVVLARPPLAAAFASTDVRVMNPDELGDLGEPRPRAPNDIAYVIFTSGSTGTPKGVAVGRTALEHYVDWAGAAMGVGPGDRLSQHPNLGFDMSVHDIYGALCYGASLHPLARPIDRLLPARKIAADRLTLWNSVPSIVSLMEQSGEVDAALLASVRLFSFCGEMLRPEQVAALFRARPDAIVFNTYGPTEATVAMTCRRFTRHDFAALCEPSAPIGDPIGDMRLDLVGDGDGDAGELVLSGPQVALGYWRDPALTAEKFRDVATLSGPARAFWTGDYGVRRGGEIYFVGRRDDMIKLHGHRIHLGEIRTALRQLGWPASVVFERDEALFAVVEAQAGVAFDEADVLARLAGLLDRYFLPQRILAIERFPLGANDKIDTAALKRLFDEPASR